MTAPAITPTPCPHQEQTHQQKAQLRRTCACSAGVAAATAQMPDNHCHQHLTQVLLNDNPCSLQGLYWPLPATAAGQQQAAMKAAPAKAQPLLWD